MKTLLVGGAVRDRLMGNPSADRDWVVVGSSPEEMMALGFDQVGASFPVFLHPETREEHALARTETKNGKGYHGFTVEFSADITLEEDLFRRDLTINSIAYDEVEDRYIDPFNGQHDIQHKVLRHTSSAFSDDPLRVIRLARFAARFPSFSIHPSTMALAKEVAASGVLNDLPFERIATEVKKTLSACTEMKQVRRFFEVLKDIDASKTVTFFHRADLDWLLDVGKVCLMVKGPQRLTVFAALSKLGEAQRVQLGGAEGSEMGNHLQALRELPAVTPATIHDLLKRASGFASDERRWSLFLLCVAVGNIAGDNYAVGERALICAQKLTLPIASMMALWMTPTGRSGKEIGEAIRTERLRLLASIFPST
jgi:tRNA nucleotidyltransferase/poly(A) polymerase